MVVVGCVCVQTEGGGCRWTWLGGKKEKGVIAVLWEPCGFLGACGASRGWQGWGRSGNGEGRGGVSMKLSAQWSNDVIHRAGSWLPRCFVSVDRPPLSG